MKLLRLEGRKTSEYVLRKGRVWKGKTFTAYILPGAPRNMQAKRDATSAPTTAEGLYVGTFASTRLHKSAVQRNRMRRRVREALRITVKDLQGIPSTQLLLTPRSASLTSPYEDILKDVSMLLAQLSSWPPQSAPRNSGISS